MPLVRSLIFVLCFFCSNVLLAQRFKLEYGVIGDSITFSKHTDLMASSMITTKSNQTYLALSNFDTIWVYRFEMGKWMQLGAPILLSEHTHIELYEAGNGELFIAMPTYQVGYVYKWNGEKWMEWFSIEGKFLLQTSFTDVVNTTMFLITAVGNTINVYKLDLISRKVLAAGSAYFEDFEYYYSIKALDEKVAIVGYLNPKDFVQLYILKEGNFTRCTIPNTWKTPEPQNYLAKGSKRKVSISIIEKDASTSLYEIDENEIAKICTLTTQPVDYNRWLITEEKKVFYLFRTGDYYYFGSLSREESFYSEKIREAFYCGSGANSSLGFGAAGKILISLFCTSKEHYFVDPLVIEIQF